MNDIYAENHQNDPDAAKLLPCPKCGAPATTRDTTNWIECSNYDGCGMALVTAPNKEVAKARWNTRSQPRRQYSRREIENAAYRKAAREAAKWDVFDQLDGTKPRLVIATAIRALIQPPAQPGDKP